MLEKCLMSRLMSIAWGNRFKHCEDDGVDSRKDLSSASYNLEGIWIIDGFSAA
jgi:hypothetical protein